MKPNSSTQSNEDKPQVCSNCFKPETQYNKVLPIEVAPNTSVFMNICTRCRKEEL